MSSFQLGSAIDEGLRRPQPGVGPVALALKLDLEAAIEKEDRVVLEALTEGGALLDCPVSEGLVASRSAVEGSAALSATSIPGGTRS